MSFYVVMMRTLSILAVVGSVGALGLLAAHLTPGGRRGVRRRFAGQAVTLIGQAGAVALVATLGSLYLSEVTGFAPCILCWYQRIAMYPLVAVCGVAVLARDPSAWRYGLPLAGVGLAIALYHVALQWQPALDVVSCDASAPCTGRYVLVFGFISIPTLSAAAFALIAALLVTARTVSGSPSPPAAQSPSTAERQSSPI